MDLVQVILGLVVVLLMLGLGAAMSVSDFKRAIRMWKAPLVALMCQFAFMPLICFGLALALDVQHEHGLSMLVVGCSPGGSTSNLFAYYSRADVPLSVLATTLSTLFSVGMMPLCLYIYSPPFTDEHVKIPFGSLIAPLAMVIVPVGLGIGLRYLSPRAAFWLEKAASAVGSVFILAALVAGVVTNLHLFSESWKLWVASAVLMPIGGTMGYVNSRLARLPVSACRTICLETGLQNSTLALSILAFSFEGPRFRTMAVFPLLYSLFLLVDGTLLTLLFRFLSWKEGEAGKAPASEAPSEISKKSCDARVTEEDLPPQFEPVV